MTARTSELLAKELDILELKDMAILARRDYYHDFLSELATPTTKLVQDLADAAQRMPYIKTRDKILALRKRVINGEFDADKKESDEWAASKEGIDTFKQLLGKKP